MSRQPVTGTRYTCECCGREVTVFHNLDQPLGWLVVWVTVKDDAREVGAPPTTRCVPLDVCSVCGPRAAKRLADALGVKAPTEKTCNGPDCEPGCEGTYGGCVP